MASLSRLLSWFRLGTKEKPQNQHPTDNDWFKGYVGRVDPPGEPLKRVGDVLMVDVSQLPTGVDISEVHSSFESFKVFEAARRSDLRVSLSFWGSLPTPLEVVLDYDEPLQRNFIAHMEHVQSLHPGAVLRVDGYRHHSLNERAPGSKIEGEVWVHIFDMQLPKEPLLHKFYLGSPVPTDKELLTIKEII